MDCDLDMRGRERIRGKYRHPRMGKRDPEFEQLVVDARCAPKRICQTHLSNQVLNLLRNLAAPKPQASARPPPLEAKPRTMPTNHRFRFGDGEAGSPASPEARQTDPEETIGGVKGSRFRPRCSTVI